MGFWIFMLVVDLLVPFTMLVFGSLFLRNAPKDINYAFGYRTGMSMKNKDTWAFAHNYCGRIWYRAGLIMMPITVVVLCLVIGESQDTIGTVGGMLCGVQMIPLIGSIIPTEVALRKQFDENGNRR